MRATKVMHVDANPAERIAFRSFGAMEGTQTVAVEPDNGGSKVTHHMDSRLPVPLVGRFLDPILRWGWEKNLAWAKREIEKQPKVEETTAQLRLTLKGAEQQEPPASQGVLHARRDSLLSLAPGPILLIRIHIDPVTSGVVRAVGCA